MQEWIDYIAGLEDPPSPGISLSDKSLEVTGITGGVQTTSSTTLNADHRNAITLALPDEDITLDFFPDNYVRVNAGGDGTLYQAMWYDETVSFTEALQGWCYAEAEADGLREPDTSLDGYLGEWSEKIAGRAYISIEKGLAPGTAKIQANWPDSAAVMNVWHMTARLDEEGNLGYELGQWEQIEFDEEGNDWTLDSSWEESGWFWLNDDGELRWHNNTFESDEDSTFIR